MPVEAGGLGMSLAAVQRLTVYQFFLLSQDLQALERAKRRQKIIRLGHGDENEGLRRQKLELRKRFTGCEEL